MNTALVLVEHACTLMRIEALFRSSNPCRHYCVLLCLLQVRLLPCTLRLLATAWMLWSGAHTPGSWRWTSSAPTS